MSVAAVTAEPVVEEPSLKLTLLYQDEWLVAVNKPSGLLVHRSWLDKAETRFAMQMTRDLIGGRHVYPVHRLDRPTSGVLLFALSPAVARTLTEAFTHRQVHKEYLALVRGWADMVERDLNPGLIAHVEFSNEVWNWQFAQAHWAEAEGKALWNQDNTWVQFYARRAAEVADIWADVFKDDPARLVRVIAVQTGWLGLEEQILDAPLVVAEGRPAPVESFDAYAVTGYFSALLGADDKALTVKGWLVQSKDADPANPYALANAMAADELRDGRVTGQTEDTLTTLLGQTLPYHASIAADRGLALVMYEGGTHVVGFGAQMEDAELTAFFSQLNYTPEMGALYGELLAGWSLISDQPFNAFVDVYSPGKWGSWGALRHLGDDSPRWQALAKGCHGC